MTEAKQKAKTSSMAFNSLKQTNQKLHQNPELSEHKKEVLQNFFRKSRAIYKASIGWTEYQLREFFGWSKNSDAPKH